MDKDMPATTTYASTGNAYVDGVLGDVKWAVNEFTFSFPTSGSFYGGRYGSGEPTNNFGTLNAAQQAAARATFDAYSSVANLTFTEIAETSTQHADLRLAMSDAPSTAWAYLPSTAAEGGDAWFNKSSGYYSSPVKGNYAYATILHETGHALGLEHAHEAYAMPADRDSMEYTVMSYRSYVGASLGGGYTNEKAGYAQSLMMYDIAALQHMYGADYSTNSGDTRYSWSSSTGEMLINGVAQGAPGANRIFLTVWDGGGNDTYDFGNYTTDLNVDLRPGSWTTTSSTQLAKLHYDGSKVAAGNIANALLHNNDGRSLIENAMGGAGSDMIVGNDASNKLWGNANNDSLYGGGGDDVFHGGSGGDLMDGGNGIDTVVYSLAASRDPAIGLGLIADLLYSYVNTGEAFLDTFLSIERLFGSAFDDDLRGDDLDNVLSALNGNDHVYGRLGADHLYGGDGNDTLWGGAGNDSLFGENGDDHLLGGPGADRLDGGSGIDTANYSSSSEPLTADLLYAYVNTGEGAGDSYFSIERLTGSNYADDLRGDDRDNVLNALGSDDALYGRGGADLLYGGEGNDRLCGGAGADWLEGGTGSDVFVFWSLGESLPESRDTIADFSPGLDRVDLHAMDADAFLAGDQQFSYIENQGFSGRVGELRFGGGVLSGDIDGDAIADFQINVLNVSTLVESDFYL